jgi:hypothetical protein
MLLSSPRSLCKTACRDSQSPTRNRCSQCRKSPWKPMLSATLNVEMTQRSFCLPLFAGALASGPVFPARPVEVSRELVVLTRV